MQDVTLSGETTDTFSKLCSSLTQLLRMIPDNQDDRDLQSAELTPVVFRSETEAMLDADKKTISPKQLTVHGREFNHLFKVATFIYKITDGIPGLTQLNDFIFALLNPIKLIEKNKSDNTYAINYLNACLKNTAPFGLNPNPIILVLGTQHGDGNHENLEIYKSLSAVLGKKMGNISQYNLNICTDNFRASLLIFHANMPGFQDQHLDSPDIDELFNIYRIAIETKRRLMIHCKDGMDRTGAVSLALHLLHHWDRIFLSGEQGAQEKRRSLSDHLSQTQLLTIAENIKAEHAAMQDLRGPGFCVAQNSLLRGAVQLAFILKAIQISHALCENDGDLHAHACKDYMKVLYSLEQLRNERGGLSTSQNYLLTTLRIRANIESAYFDDLSREIPHTAITLFNIDKMISSNIDLGGGALEIDFLARFNQIQTRYINDEDVTNDLIELDLDIRIQSTLIEIHAAQRLTARTQDQRSIDETIEAEIIKGTESKKIKLNKLTGILFKLELNQRIQKIETSLSVAKLSEEVLEKKRSDLTAKKNVIETHLKAIQRLGFDKRKQIKACIIDLEQFENSLEVPTNSDTTLPTGRRRGNSNPASLKEFAKLVLGPTSPRLSRSSTKNTEVSPPPETPDSSAKLSPPTSPRKIFAKLSTSLSRSSGKMSWASPPPETPDTTANLSPPVSPRSILSKLTTASRASAKKIEDSAPIETPDTSAKTTSPPPSPSFLKHKLLSKLAPSSRSSARSTGVSAQSEGLSKSLSSLPKSMTPQFRPYSEREKLTVQQVSQRLIEKAEQDSFLAFLADDPPSGDETTDTDPTKKGEFTF